MVLDSLYLFSIGSPNDMIINLMNKAPAVEKYRFRVLRVSKKVNYKLFRVSGSSCRPSVGNLRFRVRVFVQITEERLSGGRCNMSLPPRGIFLRVCTPYINAYNRACLKVNYV